MNTAPVCATAGWLVELFFFGAGLGLLAAGFLSAIAGAGLISGAVVSVTTGFTASFMVSTLGCTFFSTAAVPLAAASFRMMLEVSRTCFLIVGAGCGVGAGAGGVSCITTELDARGVKLGRSIFMVSAAVVLTSSTAFLISGFGGAGAGGVEIFGIGKSDLISLGVKVGIGVDLGAGAGVGAGLTLGAAGAAAAGLGVDAGSSKSVLTLPPFFSYSSMRARRAAASSERSPGAV